MTGVSTPNSQGAILTPASRPVPPSLDLSDITRNRPRMLLVGFGKAGGRFFRALRYLQTHTGALQVVGICDTNDERFDQVDDSDVRLFTDLRVALAELEPEIVCVCVNEVGHYDALMTIAKTPSVRAVFTEKPFTETLAQAEAIVPALGERLVCVNFVERYSPIVDRFREWSAFHGAQVTRVEFHWGKYRYMDARPTMGVLSEISHPIDLVRCLLGTDNQSPVDVHDASGSRSQFSVVEQSLIDTVDIFYSTGGTVVRGHSSFLWNDRDRRVVLYGRSRLNGSLFQAVLEFDRPRWDCDTLEVTRIDEQTGEREIVLAHRCTYEDFPVELSYIFKVSRFCATALRAVYAEQHRNKLALAEDALWVQRVIEVIAEKVGECHVINL